MICVRKFWKKPRKCSTNPSWRTFERSCWSVYPTERFFPYDLLPISKSRLSLDLLGRMFCGTVQHDAEEFVISKCAQELGQRIQRKGLAIPKV